MICVIRFFQDVPRVSLVCSLMLHVRSRTCVYIVHDTTGRRHCRSHRSRFRFKHLCACRDLIRKPVCVNAACQRSSEDAAVQPTDLSELRHPRQAAISSFRRRGEGGCRAGRIDTANVLMLKGLSQNRGGEAPRTDISSTDRAACRDYISPRRDTNRSL